MWGGSYCQRLIDSWTPMNGRAPRWFASNLYPELSSVLIAPPTSGSAVSYNPSYANANRIPNAWALASDISTPATGYILQNLLEAFASETQILKQGLINTFLKVSRTYDPSEVEFVWVVEYQDNVHTLEVRLQNGTWVDVEEALGEYDLLHSPKWKWLQSGNQIVISGLDLFDYSSESKVDNWQFLNLDRAASHASQSVVHYIHPYSKSWVYIHPLEIRSDGFLGYWAEASPVRFRVPLVASELIELEIRINNLYETTATITTPWTSTDEQGLWFGLSRRERETTYNYTNRLNLLPLVWGQTKSELQMTIGTHLNQTVLNTFTTSLSALSVSTSRIYIPNYKKTIYLTEKLTPDIYNTNLWRSQYATPELGSFFLNGRRVSFSVVNTSGSLFSPNSVSSNVVDNLLAHWKISLWSENSTGFVLTNNFPQTITQLQYVTSSNIQINTEPSTNVKRRKLRNTASFLKWGSNKQTSMYIGIAEFS